MRYTFITQPAVTVIKSSDIVFPKARRLAILWLDRPVPAAVFRWLLGVIAIKAESPDSDMDTELTRLEEQLQLMEYSLWHINWAIVFTISAVVTETVVFVELFRGDMGGAFEVWGISLILLVISMHLRRKSREFFERAHDE